MKFYDLDTESIITPAELKENWEAIREEQFGPGDPLFEHFAIYFLEVIYATINDRNDLIFMNQTPREIEGILRKINKKYPC